MVLSIGERIKGFLVSPSKTFDDSKEDTIGDAFKYFVVFLMIYAVLVVILFAVVLLFAGMMGLPFVAEISVLVVLVAVSGFISVIVGGIIAVFFIGLWTHIWVYAVGGRKGVTQTMKAVMYGATPSFFLGWIPIVGFFAAIWALIVGIIGVRQLHELSTGKAVLAFILAIVMLGIIAAIVTFAALITMPELIPELGPGFGGY